MLQNPALKSLISFFLPHCAAALLAAVPALPLQTAPGWTAEIIIQAPEIRHPSVVCAAPDGRIFVAEDPMDISSRNASVQEGRILCLHPDGRRTVFADQLHAVFGMQYLEGKLYVLHNPRFTVFADDNGIGRNPSNLIESTLPEPWAGDWNDHVPANFRLGMDGFFYIAVGDKGLHGAVGTDGRRADLNGGGLARIRPDGTRLEVMASGVRNILDLAMNSEDEMFTYDNTDEHDWMGRVTHMIDGGEYGYPHDFVPRRSHTLWMFADYGPGAACGALAWNNDSLPEDHRGNLILADFGQRNLRRVQLARQGGTYAAARDEQLVINPPGDFRPVGITETLDGIGLYVCDWQAVDSKAQVTVGRLWKFTKTNGIPAELPRWWTSAASGHGTEVSDAVLLAGLEHSLRSVRLAAQRELARRGPSAAQALAAIARDEQASVKARWHAIWTIPRGAQNQELITDLTRSPNSSVQRQALRWLGEHRAIEALPSCVAQLGHADHSVRLCAAIALGRIGAPEAIPPLLEACTDDNLFPRFASFTALRRIGQAAPGSWPVIVHGLRHHNARVREAAGFCFRNVFSLPLIEALALSSADSDSTARLGAFRALSGLVHQPPAEWKWWFYHPALNPPPPRNRVWDGTSLVLATLRRGISDNHAEIRAEAIRALGKANDNFSAPILRDRLRDDPAPVVRNAALIALADLQDSEAAPLVAAIIANPDSHSNLWQEAVERSGAFAQPGVETALIGLLQDPTSPHRASAVVTALGARKSEAAVLDLKLLAMSQSTVRSNAVAALGRIASTNAIAALRAVAASSPFDPEPVRALAATRHREAIPDLIAAWNRSATREAAFTGLLDIPDLRALDIYIDGLSSPRAALRDKCRAILAKWPRDIWPRLSTRTQPLPPLAIKPLREILTGQTDALASPLLTDKATQDGAGDANVYRAFALDHPGDAWRGQHIFFDSRTGCVNCHTIAEHGKAVGPDLTTAGAQFAPKELIDSILTPNQNIREGYQQFEVELKDGESLSGAIRGESPENLVLVDATARSVTIPKSTIKSRTALTLSLMPEGLHAALSREEFSDLVAFIASLKTDPRRGQVLPVPEGFKPLFNGRDLEGWQPAKDWSAKQGILESNDSKATLATARVLLDFEVILEWRLTDPPELSNSIATPVNAVNKPTTSIPRSNLEVSRGGISIAGFDQPLFILLNDPHGSGGLVASAAAQVQGSGSENYIAKPSLRADRPLGQWNELKLRVKGKTVSIALNGKPVVEAQIQSATRLAGQIGLKPIKGHVQFRNLALLEFD